MSDHQDKPDAPRSKRSPKKAAQKKAEAVTLLAGGNPHIPKGEGDAPVQAYLAALSGWKQTLCTEIDQLIVKTVPNVRKAVKWNSPFYGGQKEGWFLSYHVFTRYVKVTFFKGTSLRPAPPKVARHGGSTSMKRSPWTKSNSPNGSSKQPRFPAGLPRTWISHSD